MSDNLISNENNKDLIVALNTVDSLVSRKYLSVLRDCDVLPLNKDLENKNLTDYFRMYKVEKIVFEKSENNQTKLSTVYQSLHSLGTSVVTIIESNEVNINFYLGVKHFDNLYTSQDALAKSFNGNFLGSELRLVKNSEVKEIISKFEAYEGNKTISACSLVSNIKNHKIEDNSFVQGIEKLIEAMKGEKYTLLIISDPISNNELSVIKRGYEEVYSQLLPFSKNQLTFSTNESFALSSSDTDSISKTLTEGISKTQTTSLTESEAITHTKGINFNANIFGLAGVFGGALGGGVHFDKSNTKGTSRGTSDSIGTTTSDSNTIGSSHTKGITNTTGSSNSIQIETINKSIVNLIEDIDKNIARINDCSDFGVWNTCTYILTNDMQTNSTISSIYHSIMRGEDSSITTSAINTWSNDSPKDSISLKEINKYISKLHHPIFLLNSSTLVSPASLVSSSELSIQASIPQKSVPGLAVIDYSSFAREVLYSNNSFDNNNCISCGNIFHLGKEESIEVNLNTQSLTSHTFVTGSTGSGKSNTLYHIIENLLYKSINFMVIEPAKGEYKNIFGYRNDVEVYGTNPNYSTLLRINPFSFNDSVHVLEHIDRLIDIFNVCWPMYAAMPAILKESIERAYINAGWDLDLSKNIYGSEIFPSFIDVLDSLKIEIERSDFSAELKSNYTGALVTRIKSLTNGLVGRIFTPNELKETELFDKNVIVDLSRIGSSETKSLIMGILIMKLSEYRSSSKEMNQPLKHITVLEEAHNILKRTSTEQNMEGANLVGKSVEMLSNAIAEMRTFGEGFIIVDQSPSAVDMSAIRNTNTKIILRLPDFSDREVVGKACSLTDEQISELARLETGVACVYQNNWVEAVLSKVKKIDIKESYYHKRDEKFFEYTKIKNNFLKYIAKLHLKENLETSKESLVHLVKELDTNIANKIHLTNFIIGQDTSNYNISNLLYNMFDGKSFMYKVNNIEDIDSFHKVLYSNLFNNSVSLESKYVNEILNLFMIGIISNLNVDKEFYNYWSSKFYIGVNFL